MLRFAITDTGIGIPYEAQKRLFQPFSQADGSTTRKYGGTGLGLVICKQLVERMGGEIGVRSSADEGSTFWFTVQLEKQGAGAIAALPAKNELVGKHVLIVDDHPTRHKVLHHYVDSWGLRNGEIAIDRHQALELMRREAAAGNPFDFVLLDLQHPERDALPLAEKIKSDPALACARLLLLTPLNNRLPGPVVHAAGIAASVIKPVRQSILYDSLVNLLTEDPTAFGSGSASSAAASASPAPNPLRILVAEDNAVNQKVALRQLEKLGHYADVAANGIEVLDALNKIPYDVVLMDCQMPEMDGYEATRSIRKLAFAETPRKRRIALVYIVAMTANAMPGDREQCLSAGMDDYITKPMRIEELRSAIGKFTAAGQLTASPAG